MTPNSSFFQDGARIMLLIKSLKGVVSARALKSPLAECHVSITVKLDTEHTARMAKVNIIIKKF